ncbi:MAG: hypothetical protein JW797_11280 [Bradymonadales bacterium]|nr:hypothetical protein [Bradymonadales bacterium]
MSGFGFKRVTIERDVAELPVARRWADYALQQRLELVWAEPQSAAIHQGKSLYEGKQEVVVCRSKGSAIKPCRGRDTRCVPCNLHVINQTSNCPFNCSYCFLQIYVNNPVTTVHADVEEMIDQVERLLATQPERLFRVTTGDLGDSLALDEISLVNRDLVERFARTSNGLLELKTKSHRVEPLLDLDHRGRTVVSWSMNTPEMIAAEEHRCASLEERLEAARRVVEAGYLVAFHFDPMIVHDSWQEGYPAVARRIFETVPAGRVAWVSLGSFRFHPPLLERVEHRFPGSRITLGELTLASDGKIRYFKPIRIGLYQILWKAIREAGGPDPFVYLCMELPELWRRVAGHVPEPDYGLDFEFACSLVRRYPWLMKRPPRREAYQGAGLLGG